MRNRESMGAAQPFATRHPVGAARFGFDEEARGRTQSRSISTATERCNNVSDTTRRRRFFIATRIPSSPAIDPSSTTTASPALRKGQGSMGRPDVMNLRIAWSSSSGTGSGRLPKPTMCNTPGIVSTGSRRFISKEPKTYPGNNGNSICFLRSDHRESFRYKGRNSEYPFPLNVSETSFSQFDRTRSAYHSSADSL